MLDNSHVRKSSKKGNNNINKTNSVQIGIGGLTSPFGQPPLPKKLIITCTNNRIQNCHQGNNKVTVDSIII